MLRRLVLTAALLGPVACAAPPSPGLPVAVAAPGPSLAERLAEDQQRINEARRLGQLTPAEFNELQGRHDAIERTRREQLAIGGGRFAPGQYEALLERQDALSRTIFAYRHNGATPTAH